MKTQIHSILFPLISMAPSVRGGLHTCFITAGFLTLHMLVCGLVLSSLYAELSSDSLRFSFVVVVVLTIRENAVVIKKKKII